MADKKLAGIGDQQGLEGARGRAYVQLDPVRSAWILRVGAL